MWKRLKGISTLLESYGEKQIISNYRSRRKKVSSGVALGDVTTWSNEIVAELASVVAVTVVVTGKRLNEIKREASVEGGEEEDFFAEEKERAFGI